MARRKSAPGSRHPTGSAQAMRGKRRRATSLVSTSCSSGGACLPAGSHRSRRLVRLDPADHLPAPCNLDGSTLGSVILSGHMGSTVRRGSSRVDWLRASTRDQRCSRLVCLRPRRFTLQLSSSDPVKPRGQTTELRWTGVTLTLFAALRLHEKKDHRLTISLPSIFDGLVL
jgi:hypothetical protein